MSDKRARKEAKRKRQQKKARKAAQARSLAERASYQLQPFAAEDLEEFMATLESPPLSQDQWPEAVRNQVADLVEIAHTEGEAIVVHRTPHGSIRATAESVIVEFVPQADGRWQQTWYHVAFGRPVS